MAQRLAEKRQTEECQQVLNRKIVAIQRVSIKFMFMGQHNFGDLIHNFMPQFLAEGVDFIIIPLTDDYYDQSMRLKFWNNY